MPAESKELMQARGLLAKFEAEMHKPEGVVHLSEALALLADVRDNETGKTGELAANIALAYTRKIQREIEALARETIVHRDVVEHWHNVFQEFADSGFALPPELATAHSTLLLKKMSPAERQVLLERRQALDKGSD